ncbi:ABC transporter permease [Paenibacillus yanchengensis]|uniref:ABC transporter permease n=1 Tax=Paenibacillus yanchengensis TaxID=2035833 RepID=A0ABW4YP68_9BACL
MTMRDSLQFVMRNVKKNKTRLMMTVLATAMGCCFLIVLLSVGIGFKQSIVDHMVGDRLVTEIQVHGKIEGNNNDITTSDMEKFKQLPNIKTITYKNYVQQDLLPKLEEQLLSNSPVMQVDFAAEAIAGFKLSAGVMPNAEAAEVILGYHAIEDTSNVIGKTLELTVHYHEDNKVKQQIVPVVITGISEKPSREWQQDTMIYVGEHTLQQIEQLTKTQFGLLPPLAEELEQFLEGQAVEQNGNKVVFDEKDLPAIPSPTDDRIYQNVTIVATHMKHVTKLSEQMKEQGYYNYSVVSELKQLDVIFTVITIGLSFIGIIAILIASIGIFNTMTMAVTERYQDIGIMKAIGAHPAVIKRIFLLESALIGLLGAIVGTIVAYIISGVVNWALPIAIEIFMEQKLPSGFTFSSIPFILVLSASILSLVVAMLSGYRPAKRATQIDVLRALRRDV